MVADGMGGKEWRSHRSRASHCSAKMLFDEFFPGNDIKAMLQAIVNEAHTVIKLSAVSSEKEPPQHLRGNRGFPSETVWAHVGDSRLYRFTGPNFSERTKDHSMLKDWSMKA